MTLMNVKLNIQKSDKYYYILSADIPKQQRKEIDEMLKNMGWIYTKSINRSKVNKCGYKRLKNNNEEINENINTSYEEWIIKLNMN